MDTAAICQYLANTLKAAQSFDLLVLKALVSDMTVSLPSTSLPKLQQQQLMNQAGFAQIGVSFQSRICCC